MKMFFVLTCCLALASVAFGAKPQDSPAPKKGAGHSQASQHATVPGHAVGAGRPAGAGVGSKKTSMGAYEGPRKSGKTSIGAYEGQKGQTKKSLGAPDTKPGKSTAQGAAITSTGGAKSFKPQRYNLATKTKPTAIAPAVTYSAGSRIQGSQNWQGSRYTAFRSYSPQWHDRNWWGSHYNRIVFVFGGWYYWNSGYWYPAWGYDPNAYYFYDGPIYGYNDLPPDQVIANVQAALQEQGYYEGDVDGVLGPLTRAAIANYQRDQGLYITSAIDEPTLASLGMV